MASTSENPRAAGFQSLLNLMGWKANGEKKTRAESRTDSRMRSRYEGTIASAAGTMQIRGIDLHATGAGVRTSRRLEPGTIVFVHLRTFKLMGFVFVQNCKPCGLGFRAGLRFSKPLMREDLGRWQYQHVRQAAGSPQRWKKLIGKDEVCFESNPGSVEEWTEPEE